MPVSKATSTPWYTPTNVRIILGAIVVVFLVSAGYAVSQVQDIVLTGPQIQDKIDNALPVTKDGVTVKSATVTIDDKISVRSHVEGEKFKIPFSIKVNTAGDVHYDESKGALYYLPADLSIEEFTTSGVSVSSALEDSASKVVDSALVDGVIQGLEKQEGTVHVIGNFLRTKRATASEGVSTVSKQVEEKIHAVATTAVVSRLKVTPVYTLPDDLRGNTARLLVTGMEISDGALIVHLSFWKLSWYVLMFLGFAGVFIFLAIYCPEILEVFGLLVEVGEIVA